MKSRVFNCFKVGILGTSFSDIKVVAVYDKPQ